LKAIAVYPGRGDLHLTDIEEPRITTDKDVKAEVLSVGICGTDRNELRGGRAEAPAGKDELIIGHEVFCRITEVGKKVTKVKPGDYGVFTVRRGCGECLPCSLNRSDMCLTGKYKERGIKQLNGFQCEYVVDHEDYLVKVPEDIKDIGVLTEPASIIEKAIYEATIIQQARIPGYNKDHGLKSLKVLVAGVGAIGLIGSFILAIHGAEVWGLDIVDEDSLRVTLLKEIGGNYIDGRNIKANDIDKYFGEMDLIIEAIGNSKLGFDLIDALGVNGIYVKTGIPEGTNLIEIDGNTLMRQMVLKNQVIIGSVNASLNNFDSAVTDLTGINKKWGHSIRKVITRSVPAAEFNKGFVKKATDIKTVISWKN
jgi:glucose 1-dehydrogenase